MFKDLHPALSPSKQLATFKELQPTLSSLKFLLQLQSSQPTNDRFKGFYYLQYRIFIFYIFISGFDLLDLLRCCLYLISALHYRICHGFGCGVTGCKFQLQVYFRLRRQFEINIVSVIGSLLLCLFPQQIETLGSKGTLSLSLSLPLFLKQYVLFHLCFLRFFLLSVRFCKWKCKLNLQVALFVGCKMSNMWVKCETVATIGVVCKFLFVQTT